VSGGLYYALMAASEFRADQREDSAKQLQITK
jgi:hypothetical protein